MLEVKKITWDFLDSNMYILQEGNHYLVIDPIDNDATFKIAVNAASVTIFLTHEHFDHICGLNTLRDICECKYENNYRVNKMNEGTFFRNSDDSIGSSFCCVIASEKCSVRIQNTKANLSVYADTLGELSGKPIHRNIKPFKCNEANITFKDSFLFHWMGHSVELFSTPGHSAGSSCALVDNLLFVGDKVLENNLMVRFPGSSKALFKNVARVLLEKLLIKTSVVYPGHGNSISPDKATKIIREI